jgi:DNA-binding HxlR family transcriptional regulator
MPLTTRGGEETVGNLLTGFYRVSVHHPAQRVAHEGFGAMVQKEPRMAAIPPPKRHPYDQWAPDARALDLVGDKWTLLIVRDLSSGPRRFVELQRVLPGISTEQLRSRLNRMVADGQLTRQRYREVPPRVDYELTKRSRELLPVLGALARWGYDWAWTAPREGEAIDIGAILRIAPGMTSPPANQSGTAELTVTRPDGTVWHYALTVARGTVTIAEEPAPDADARIAGSERDWIDAMRPDGDRDALDVSGDERLAKTVLDGVCASAASTARRLRTA